MHENRTKSVKVSEFDEPMSSVVDNDVSIVGEDGSGNRGSGRTGSGVDILIRSHKSRFVRENGGGSRSSSVGDDVDSESEKTGRENERSKCFDWAFFSLR